MTHSSTSADQRPYTAVLHQFVGMGDLVWHAQYFREIAKQSRDGQVSVIASPTTFARELLGHEPWVREIIDFDRRPRRSEKRAGRHSGVAGLFRMGAELKPLGFDRIALFTHHANRAIVAWRAGIAQRIGYGTSVLQRLLLSKTPWITGYKGPAVAVYKDATAFMLAQGWCDAPIVPRLSVRPDALARMQARLAQLPHPLHAFTIGSSEPFKQWGAANFSALANALAGQGHGILILGGPVETELAQAIIAGIEPAYRHQVMAITDGTVSETVAALSLAQTCAGNDTGATNIAAAVGTPTQVILGPRPDLEHDPKHLHMIKATHLLDITPADVQKRLLKSLAITI
ncbi:glycosyltransferase family 9 protein [Roseateles koreensis]|uniref:Glycosyltransferase family 9 protein n=1 Tax=Roseateles koreensis TaxID=2987526 RepID=A0ABT5KX78_9BURK|nr:glycosyltransferase family 9 protein [Roseateles koreensis]MDC8786953.1 glycosyltransferase family 9 protein [Roseateles koreensis]